MKPIRLHTGLLEGKLCTPNTTNMVYMYINLLRLRDSASGRGNAVAHDQHICIVYGASAAKYYPAEAQCLPKAYSKSGAEIAHAH